MEHVNSLTMLDNCSASYVNENLIKMRNLNKTLRQRVDFYRDQNAKYEAMFLNLQMLNSSLELNSNLAKAANRLSQLEDQWNTKHLTTNSLVLSHADRQRKQKNYLSKIKICVKMYIHLNKQLTKALEATKDELKKSKANFDIILSLPSEELKAMEGKIKRYENELVKFQKKYAWLKDPQLDLPNITKEINALNNLRVEKEKLKMMLDVYHDLKPDLKEALTQLAQIKVKYEEISIKLLNKGN